MNRRRLLVIADLPPTLRDALEDGYDLVSFDERGGRRGGFDVAVTTSVAGADRALIEALPDLRLIACNGAGLEMIDLIAARAQGVAVAHTPDVLTEDTADFALALTYAITRRVVEADRFVRAGRWREGRMAPSNRVFGKMLGVVGLGKIGAAVARRGAALGLSVAYTGRHRQAQTPYRFIGDLATLAEQCDILVLTCPGGDETRHIIDAEILKRLGPTGFLVNISRGSVVDEAALLDALATKAIAGAALDVFSSEPAIDPRFLSLENVVLQPHYAAVTQETRRAIAMRVKGDIDAYFAGRPFFNAAG